MSESFSCYIFTSCRQSGFLYKCRTTGMFMDNSVEIAPEELLNIEFLIIIIPNTDYIRPLWSLSLFEPTELDIIAIFFRPNVSIKCWIDILL